MQIILAQSQYIRDTMVSCTLISFPIYYHESYGFQNISHAGTLTNYSSRFWANKLDVSSFDIVRMPLRPVRDKINVAITTNTPPKLRAAGAPEISAIVPMSSPPRAVAPQLN